MRVWLLAALAAAAALSHTAVDEDGDTVSLDAAQAPRGAARRHAWHAPKRGAQAVGEGWDPVPSRAKCKTPSHAAVWEFLASEEASKNQAMALPLPARWGAK